MLGFEDGMGNFWIIGGFKFREVAAPGAPEFSACFWSAIFFVNVELNYDFRGRVYSLFYLLNLEDRGGKPP